MEQEAKVKCYQSIYAKLKNEPGVTELGYPEKKDALVFHCNIAGDILFTYSLRMEMDLLMLRAEQVCKGEENLTIKAQNISTQFDGMMGTSYDEKIILMLSVPFAGVTDEVASKMIFDKTLEFIRYVGQELGGLEPPVEEEEVVEKVEKIPFSNDSSVKSESSPEESKGYEETDKPEESEKPEELESLEKAEFSEAPECSVEQTKNPDLSAKVDDETVNKLVEESLCSKTEQLNFREGLLEKKKILLDQKEKKIQEERDHLETQKDELLGDVRKQQEELEEKKKALAEQ